MPVIEFTEKDLKNFPALRMWQERLDWLHECASRPDRPQLVHRAFFADPEVDVQSLVRDACDYVAGIRRQFHDDGISCRANMRLSWIFSIERQCIDLPYGPLLTQDQDGRG